MVPMQYAQENNITCRTCTNRLIGMALHGTGEEQYIPVRVAVDY